MGKRESDSLGSAYSLSVAPDSKGHVQATKEGADTGDKSGF